MAPGIVRRYDASSKRAMIQPALLISYTDGREARKPPLLDVPVIHPTGGGYILHVPLEVGDPVLILFSERGITKWKESFGESRIDNIGMHNERDAICLPGFGALSGTMIRPGLSLQTEDGSVAVQVESGGITLRGRVSVTGDLAVDGTLTQGGVDVGSGHQHPKEDTSIPPNPALTGPVS